MHPLRPLRDDVHQGHEDRRAEDGRQMVSRPAGISVRCAVPVSPVCPVNFLNDIRAHRQDACARCYNEFNEGLNTRKPVNILYPQAVPRVPVISEDSCVHLNTGACGICKTICGVGAIDYAHTEKEKEIEIGSVIFSPGIEVFDAGLRGEFGYGL